MPDNKPEREHPYWRIIGLPKLGSREGAAGEQLRPGMGSFGRPGGRHMPKANKEEVEYLRQEQQTPHLRKPSAVMSHPHDNTKSIWHVSDYYSAGTHREDYSRIISTHQTEDEARARASGRADRLGVQHIHTQTPQGRLPTPDSPGENN